MNESILGPIIGALIAGIAGLITTYGYWYFKNKLDKQNIARSFYFEIEKLNTKLQIFDFSEFCDNPDILKFIELPIYPAKTGFYYHHFGSIVRFNPELSERLFIFYNNIIYADENYRSDPDRADRIVPYLKKAKEILDDENFLNLLKMEISNEFSNGRKIGHEIFIGGGILLFMIFFSIYY
jgi:hypothetical protein